MIGPSINQSINQSNQSVNVSSHQNCDECNTASRILTRQHKYTKKQSNDQHFSDFAPSSWSRQLPSHYNSNELTSIVQFLRTWGPLLLSIQFYISWSQMASFQVDFGVV